MSGRAMLPGLLLVTLLSPPGCRGKQPERGPARPILVGPENVVVVRRDLLQSGPRIAGSLQPRQQAVIRAEVGGSVEKVRVDVGQRVKAGALLALIEVRDLGEQFASARSALQTAEQDRQLARRQLRRTQQLVAAGALAERDLEAERSKVAAAESRALEASARLARARKDLRAARIEAPLAGVVAERAVSAGDVVVPGAKLLTIIDPTSVRLEASVPSEHLPSLSVGTPVVFTVRGYPGQTFTGKIERIAPAADPATRQIPILVSLPNPGGQLMAGLFAEGRITSERRETLVLPLSALQQDQGRRLVTRLRNGKAERVEVKIGLRDDRTERVEVRAGLQPGDRVLVGEARDVPAGSRVELSRPPSARRGP